MKKYFIIIITAALCAASCATKSDIRDLQQQIDELSTGRIATAEEQMKSISTTADELTDLLTSLKKESESISYSDFKSLESTISGAIGDLKKYIDDQDAANRSWCQQTLATLDAYKTLSDSMAGISTRISKMDNGLPAIKEKVDGILGNMQTWINEQFNGYYTISQADAKLNLLKEEYEGKDGELSKQLDSLSTELGALKDELSEGYTAAIQEAITSFNGSITPKIKTAISSVTSKVNSYIDQLDSRERSCYSKYVTEADIEEAYNVFGTGLIVAPNHTDGGILIKQYTNTKISIMSNKGRVIHPNQKEDYVTATVRIHFAFSDGTTWTGRMNDDSEFSFSYQNNSELLDKTEFFSGEVSATVYFTAADRGYSVPSKVFKAHAAVLPEHTVYTGVDGLCIKDDDITGPELGIDSSYPHIYSPWGGTHSHIVYCSDTECANSSDYYSGALKILPLSKDPAFLTYGQGWRSPTKDEMMSLPYDIRKAWFTAGDQIWTSTADGTTTAYYIVVDSSKELFTAYSGPRQYNRHYRGVGKDEDIMIVY